MAESEGYGWKARNGDLNGWPEQWPTRASRWPKLQPPPTWIPTRDAACTCCFDEHQHLGPVTRWDSITEAVEHLAAVSGHRCSASCTGLHLLVWTDQAGVHTYFDPPTERTRQ
ncbi:MAG TPA: hypothetical protein VGF65_15955 [Mycobacterium sp.]|jgi:hypothetical protein